ncbi:FxsA family protein [Paenactinomyces guangxiensis]|uniref:Membrane protein FxsA n=1 Tax=Paenactinomyces guangxiensis TaxID=1490290 RepID=A0A7W2A867_9BACL|nr:FxsA family protein [Paenactinomyces guangxiensis]MBA4495286.1 membrane protein FxsA [Paenactinomyces guangxiensis]MBH8592370.1 membrane protein FxsA [Paenactinomyces guangxiensis]
MFWLIVSVIIVIPVIELWGLITVGSWIGAFPTILLVIATGVIGGYLARREGIHTYRLFMIQLRNGELPGDTLLDGACVLVGGVFLLTPGFFTDIIGFLLLFPYSRGIIKLFLKRWFNKKIRNGNFIWNRRR